MHSGSRVPAHPIAAPLVSANPSNSRLSSRDAVRCVRPSAASAARRAVPAVSYTADTSSARSAAAVRAKSAVYRAAGRASISAANWRVTSRVRGRRAVDPVPTGSAAAIHALDSAVNRASRCVASVNNRYTHTRTHTHTHPFSGPLFGTTQVSRYQKGKTSLHFTEAKDSEWQWHQLGYMQVCTSLQTDDHANTPQLRFLQAGCPSCRPTNSVKALKAHQQQV